MKLIIVILVLSFILPFQAVANEESLLQLNGDKPKDLFKNEKQVKVSSEKGAKKSETLIPPDKNENYYSYIEAWYNHQDFRLNHYKKAFNLQYNLSIIIFIIVILLVLAGTYMSYLQFKKGITNTGETDTSESESELSISKEGIKIRSSVIGLLILAISFAFFYSYLRYIYPISVVPSQYNIDIGNKKR
jgi:hypothetical protein